MTISFEPTIALVNGFWNGTVRDLYIVTVIWLSATGPPAASPLSELSTLISAALGLAAARTVSKPASVTSMRHRKGAGLVRGAEPLRLPVHLDVIIPSCAGKQTLGISGRHPKRSVERLPRELLTWRDARAILVKTLSPSHKFNWTDPLINLFSLIIGYHYRPAG